MNEEETIDIPFGVSSRVTEPVQRYWFHSQYARKAGDQGEISPYYHPDFLHLVPENFIFCEELKQQLIQMSSKVKGQRVPFTGKTSADLNQFKHLPSNKIPWHLLADEFQLGWIESDAFNGVFLSPTPLTSFSIRIDITKLDTNLMRTTGQAEGYAFYRGAIPSEAQNGFTDLIGRLWVKDSQDNMVVV